MLPHLDEHAGYDLEIPVRKGQRLTARPESHQLDPGQPH